MLFSTFPIFSIKLVQRLGLRTPNATRLGSILSQISRSHMPQLRVHMLQLQILHTATKKKKKLACFNKDWKSHMLQLKLAQPNKEINILKKILCRNFKKITCPKLPVWPDWGEAEIVAQKFKCCLSFCPLGSTSGDTGMTIVGPLWDPNYGGGFVAPSTVLQLSPFLVLVSGV